jgi:hypothetical protein
MTYEDAIRVAQQKIRPERFARIAREAGAVPGQLLTVIDYLPAPSSCLNRTAWNPPLPPSPP